MNKESIVDKKTFETKEGTLEVTLIRKKWWHDLGYSGIEEDLYLKKRLDLLTISNEHIYHRCSRSSNGDWGKDAYEIVSAEGLKVELRYSHDETFFV